MPLASLMVRASQMAALLVQTSVQRPDRVSVGSSSWTVAESLPAGSLRLSGTVLMQSP
ncbi:MAG: hypothetical protein QM765_22510 [Myxococcales bacterium]